MGYIFDFEGEKNIIRVIAPIPSTNPILAAIKIRQLTSDPQGKNNILFQISPDPTRPAPQIRPDPSGSDQLPFDTSLILIN